MGMLEATSQHVKNSVSMKAMFLRQNPLIPSPRSS
jgi:hypothetical protein